MLLKQVYITVLLLSVVAGFAQHNTVFEHYSFRPYDRYVYQADHRFHTSVRPYDLEEINRIVHTDSLFVSGSSTNVLNYIRSNDLLRLDKKDFSFALNPVVNFELAQDPSQATNSYINARGFMLDACIGKNVFMFTEFNEIQSAFHDARIQKIQELGHLIVPGQGVGRVFKTNGLDYAFARSYVTYMPSRVFSFQLGHGKNFIGDGYRSLLLSDNAMNYPYFKITSTFWHIKYVNLWSQQSYMIPNQLPNSRYQKKWNAMHYLDWSVTKWLHVGLFETVVWQHEDSLGQRGFEFNYVNPVIFLRPVEFSIGSPDNVILGMTAKATVCKDHVIYGQFVLDEFRIDEFKKMNGWWGNKYGFQLGYKTFDLLNVTGLDVLAEYNYVRPFTYSHFIIPQNYSHNNQPMAHPRVSNFYEGLGIVNYNLKRWFADVKCVYLVYGEDSAGKNFGNDLFKSYTTKSMTYGNYTAQLNKTNRVMYQDISLSYLINPKSNLCVSLGISNKIEDIGNNAVNHCMYYISLRTKLSNFYFDF